MLLTLVRALILLELLGDAAAQSIRSIFLFKDVLESNTTALKTSGFNTLIIFGVGILENGDIMYYSNTEGTSDVLIASEGEYVGGDELAEKVRSFKEGDTGVNRLEVSMNAQHVEELMEAPGPGEDTPLYRNFAVLKDAWDLDAVNNDDESIYDVASTVDFARMLGEVGYKYTGAPYSFTVFWETIIGALNEGLEEGEWLMDRVYLQCYDGGWNNDPAMWQEELGMNVVPLLWVTNDSKPQYGDTVEEARARFEGWAGAVELAGGGYWNDYDVEKMELSYEEYGDVLTSVFP